MLKINYLSTLFIGIDVSARTNSVCAIDFHSNRLFSLTVPNNHPGAASLVQQILLCFEHHQNLNTLVVALEATSMYSFHIANFLSSHEALIRYTPYVYCLNPKMTANYRKSFVNLNKTDDLDAYVIADFARVGRIQSAPWRGSQFLALQRLTRHRLHLTEALTREKTYMVANIFLKFSELPLLPNQEHPFSTNYGTTALSVITDFFSTEEIVSMEPEQLVAFLSDKSKNKLPDPERTASILQKAAKDSYVLDKRLYEPLNTSLSCSINCINAFKGEIKHIDSAIAKNIKGINPNAYKILNSIPGVGPVYAAGIIAEIGDISAFHSQDALAKYTGLTWSRKQSGKYEADDTHLTKAGNSYLRYYITEAANSVKNYLPEYKDFYNKKCTEVPKHKHKRALALTSRKFVRLVYGLLTKNQLYSDSKVDNIT